MRLFSPSSRLSSSSFPAVLIHVSTRYPLANVQLKWGLRQDIPLGAEDACMSVQPRCKDLLVWDS